MSDPSSPNPSAMDRAAASLRSAIDKIQRGTAREREALGSVLQDLTDLLGKVNGSRLEIVLFGEINTGKSALINALSGSEVARVDVRGGSTRDVASTKLGEHSFVLPGFENTELILRDTPGINEVGGDERAAMAHDAAERADLILFVTDSDMNDRELDALRLLRQEATAVSPADVKPILVVFNKSDSYKKADRERLRQVLCEERLVGLIPPEDVVFAAAHPLPRWVAVEQPDGSFVEEERQSASDIAALQVRMVEKLGQHGKGLIALNALKFSSERTDRIGQLRVQYRNAEADQLIQASMLAKAAVVAVNPIGVLDVVGGVGMDVAMVVALSKLYDIDLSYFQAQQLLASIGGSAVRMIATEWATHAAAGFFKLGTGGLGTVITAVPQALAAGYTSYVVGLAAKAYFAQGASWGPDGPRAVLDEIRRSVDKSTIQAMIKQRLETLWKRGGSTPS